MRKLKLRTITLDESIPLNHQEDCPACGSRLILLCSLFNSDNSLKLRIGFCDGCGYSGYQDRPAEQWLEKFYASKWDRARQPFLNLSQSHFRALELIEKLAVNKNRGVLEIGCGYGAALDYFKKQNFSRVVGFEPSLHRAEAAIEHFGAVIINDLNQASRPFGLIFSHHVIEHVYNPNQFIKTAASLQEDGDFLILSLPNVVGEHSGYNIFYLPHLHAFSKQAVEALLNKNGYEILIDHSPSDLNTIIGAVKRKNPKSIFRKDTEYQKFYIEKFQKELALNRLIGGFYLWRWDPRDKKGGGAYIFIVKSLKRRFSDSPFEIQFTGEIKLLVK